MQSFADRTLYHGSKKHSCDESHVGSVVSGRKDVDIWTDQSSHHTFVSCHGYSHCHFVSESL